MVPASRTPSKRSETGLPAWGVPRSPSPPPITVRAPPPPPPPPADHRPGSLIRVYTIRGGKFALVKEVDLKQRWPDKWEKEWLGGEGRGGGGAGGVRGRSCHR